MNENVIDDNATTQAQARQMLENLMADGFDGDIDATALALGETTEDIKQFLNEEKELGEDLLMKIRGLATNREIEIEIE
jgi:hypothetical protein